MLSGVSCRNKLFSEASSLIVVIYCWINTLFWTRLKSVRLFINTCPSNPADTKLKTCVFKEAENYTDQNSCIFHNFAGHVRIRVTYNCKKNKTVRLLKITRKDECNHIEIALRKRQKCNKRKAFLIWKISWKMYSSSETCLPSIKFLSVKKNGWLIFKYASEILNKKSIYLCPLKYWMWQFHVEWLLLRVDRPNGAFWNEKAQCKQVKK